jgi:hypothetical protein
MKGISGIDDTLHLFVNHWPSRWGGQAASAPYRNYAASVLKSMTDSLISINPYAKIIIMGDFNDEPGDESLKKYLGAGFDYNNPETGKLYNISNEMRSRSDGSYKYQGTWYRLRSVYSFRFDDKWNGKTADISAVCKSI